MQSLQEHHLLPDAEATLALGQALAERLRPPCLVLLQGELGAGKTCLVQGLATGLGLQEAITSPTFALAQHYTSPGATPLVHLDLYRLEHPAAAEELLAQEEEEALALGAVLAVEWPERLRRIPTDGWRVLLEPAERSDPEAGRVATITPPPGADAGPQ